MAFLFADGFDFYSVPADVLQRWDSYSSTSNQVVLSSTTAFSLGQSIEFSSTNITNNITKALPSNEATVFLNFRTRRSGAQAGSTAFGFVQLRDVTTPQLTVMIDETGLLTVRSGGTAGTILGSVAAALTAGSWDSFQIKAVINNTTGSVEVRKNGSTTPLLTLSNVNTRGGTTNNYANSVVFGGTGNTSSPALNWFFDDIFVYSGVGALPNDWTGDLRAVTQAPAAMVQNQMSVFPSSTVWGQQTTSFATSVVSNSIMFIKVTAPHSGLLSTISLAVATTQTGKLNAALYSDSGGAPNALISQCTEQTNPAAGNLVLTLGTPQSATKGAAYWVAVWSNISASSWLNGAVSGVTQCSKALAYSSTFPSTAAGASGAAVGVGVSAKLDLTGITGLSAVQDATEDADTSYIYSATVGQEDLYSFSSLVSQGIAPTSVVGVMPFAIVRRSDSGARTVSVRAKSGATDAAAASSGAIGLTYGILQGFLNTDPDTGSAWTTAGVDALQVGVKVDA